jgi:hypothetical protein
MDDPFKEAWANLDRAEATESYVHRKYGYWTTLRIQLIDLMIY